MNKKPIAAVVIGFIVLVVVIVALSAGASLFLGEAPVVSSDKVALVRVEGVILDSKGVIDQLKKYSKNPSVKAIVLRIDSPGGGVVPSQEIYEEVRKLKSIDRKIVIVTSMGSVAASGGYYIASATDKIVANPGTLTGSIGVIMEFASVEELLSKIGVKSEVIKAGARKDVGNFARSMTADERDYLQKVIDDVHDQFVEAVSAGRKMSKEDIWPLADGSVYTGRQAKELGLVDLLGDQEDAVKLAGKLGGIQGEPKVIEEEKEYSVWDLLKGKDVSSLLKGFMPKSMQSLMYLYAAPSVR
ncbi:MAG TPA: signal peptide peptidase SppA [Nitrospirota bacterium]